MGIFHKVEVELYIYIIYLFFNFKYKIFFRKYNIYGIKNIFKIFYIYRIECQMTLYFSIKY